MKADRLWKKKNHRRFSLCHAFVVECKMTENTPVFGHRIHAALRRLWGGNPLGVRISQDALCGRTRMEQRLDLGSSDERFVGSTPSARTQAYLAQRQSMRLLSVGAGYRNL